MASTQCERKQLSSEQQANLDESIKCAEEFYVSGDIENKARDIAEKECKGNHELCGAGGGAFGGMLSVSAVTGAMTNQTSGPLYVIAKKQWDGHMVSSYPNPLKKFGTFAQAVIFGHVEAAVVYGGKNKRGVECGWLLAWSDANGRKIYAECGPRCKFNNIDWNKIKRELKDSNSIATANDSQTGTSMYAAMAGISPGSAVGVYYSG